MHKSTQSCYQFNEQAGLGCASNSAQFVLGCDFDAKDSVLVEEMSGHFGHSTSADHNVDATVFKIQNNLEKEEKR